MNCPICGKPMEVYVTKTTSSHTGKEYDHKRYRCRQDDVWSRIEIPKLQTLQQEPTVVAI